MIIDNVKHKKIKCEMDCKYILAQSECGYSGVFVKQIDGIYNEIFTLSHSRKNSFEISICSTVFNQFYGEYKVKKCGIFIDGFDFKRFIKCDSSDVENVKTQIHSLFINSKYIYVDTFIGRYDIKVGF